MRVLSLINNLNKEKNSLERTLLLSNHKRAAIIKNQMRILIIIIRIKIK